MTSTMVGQGSTRPQTLTAAVPGAAGGVVGEVWVGVDTHQRTHHAAVIDQTTAVLGDREFPATAAGYRELAGWAAGYGQVVAVGVEQTSTYGAGLTRHLQAAGLRVIEVNRPDLAIRASDGKTDRIDAVMAARAVHSGRATVPPKDTTGIVEAIRRLHRTRDLLVKHRTAAMNQLRDHITTAPQDLREPLLPLTTTARVTACLDLEPAGDPVHTATITSLQVLARYITQLTTQIADLTKDHNRLVTQAAPTQLSLRQVGHQIAAQILITAGENPERLRSEASFARLCGVAPIPASSGKTTRHRLHRGGDRQANRALYLIATGRMKDHPATRAYVQRKTPPGGTTNTKHIIRCLKRHIAREIYHALKTDLERLAKP